MDVIIFVFNFYMGFEIFSNFFICKINEIGDLTFVNNDDNVLLINTSTSNINNIIKSNTNIVNKKINFLRYINTQDKNNTINNIHSAYLRFETIIIVYDEITLVEDIIKYFMIAYANAKAYPNEIEDIIRLNLSFFNF